MEMQKRWIESQAACGGIGGVRLALVQKKSGRKIEMVVEEMDVKQARLFSLLNLGKFIQD